MAQMVNVGLAALVVATGWLIGRERSPRAGVVTGVVTAGIGWLTYLCGVAYVENAMLFFGLMAAAALVRAHGSQGPTSVRWMPTAGLLAGLAAGCKYPGAVLVVVPLLILAAGRSGLSVKQRIGGSLAYALAAALAFSPWLVKNAAMTGNPVFPLIGNVFAQYPEGWGEREYRHFAACHSPGPDEQSLGSRLRLLWRHVVADPDQRIGLPLMLLALAGLASRRRRRVDILCVLVLAVQFLMWMFGTHMYARFAVPLLIPLIVLASNAGRPGRWVLMAVVAGAGLNTFFAARLYAAHLYVDGQKLPVEGLPDLFTHGRVGGYEFYAAVNDDLPPDARVLLVGEARAFYFRRSVDYRVVFNRSPFVETVRAAPSEADVIAWLRKQGFTHVLVNWREIGRLRRSRYGFPDEITPDLFARLVRARLVLERTVTDSFDASPYAELYRL
jgi:MYXO-CTERM domain-containing protein